MCVCVCTSNTSFQWSSLSGDVCVVGVSLLYVLQFQVLDDKEPTEELWDAYSKQEAHARYAHFVEMSEHTREHEQKMITNTIQRERELIGTLRD